MLKMWGAIGELMNVENVGSRMLKIWGAVGELMNVENMGSIHSVAVLKMQWQVSK